MSLERYGVQMQTVPCGQYLVQCLVAVQFASQPLSPCSCQRVSPFPSSLHNPIPICGGLAIHGVFALEPAFRTRPLISCCLCDLLFVSYVLPLFAYGLRQHAAVPGHVRYGLKLRTGSATGKAVHLSRGALSRTAAPGHVFSLSYIDVPLALGPAKP